MKDFKILVCEDDKNIANSIGLYLENEGFSVIYAYDGLEAIEVFKNQGADLIIMDLMMPRLSGEEAIKKLRDISFVPIIILSAKSEDYDKVIGLNIGADDYITKPFNPLELIAPVTSAMRSSGSTTASTKSSSCRTTTGGTLKRASTWQRGASTTRPASRRNGIPR